MESHCTQIRSDGCHPIVLLRPYVPENAFQV